jgi:hypothetical protein
VQTGSREVEREDAVMAKPEMLAQIRKQVVEHILQHTEDVGERFRRRAISAMRRRNAPSAEGHRAGSR